MPGPEDSNDNILPAGDSPQRTVTTVMMPRIFEIYSVSGEELENLAEGAQPTHLLFFGLSFGAAIPIAITVITVQLDAVRNGGFIGALVVAVIASAYFGVR